MAKVLVFEGQNKDVNITIIIIIIMSCIFSSLTKNITIEIIKKLKDLTKTKVVMVWSYRKTSRR